jgi:hypothetical protein
MLEHGRPTNRGDLLTEGPEIMMGSDYFWRTKKKAIMLWSNQGPRDDCGWVVGGLTIIFERVC